MAGEDFTASKSHPSKTSLAKFIMWLLTIIYDSCVLALYDDSDHNLGQRAGPWRCFLLTLAQVLTTWQLELGVSE